MISRVRGELAAVEADRLQVMTVAGVAYEILVPARLFDSLPRVGGEVDLHTALVARDDGLELFGFGSRLERELFLRLQSASGVGPRLALSILGALASGRIISAIRDRNHAVLQTVSGVGRKTAERLALELADKLHDLAAEAPGGEVVSTAAAAQEALRALGYSVLESDSALATARRELAGREAETEELIRVALRHL
jgi:Holliday junction DNA helicase RuvA